LETYNAENETMADDAENKNSEWKEFLLDFVETIVLAVVLFLGINAVSARVRVDGFSMKPTLQDGEYVLVNKLAYRFGEPQRGDIIVFRPVNPGEELIKRVIGLPGDTVDIQDGRVLVNGQEISEPYIAAPPKDGGKWDVPQGYLFVMGDNRNNSSDSRAIGPIPLENVIGKSVLIYWPPPEWGIINHTQVAFAAP
jgi:signal peptidase I